MIHTFTGSLHGITKNHKRTVTLTIEVNNNEISQTDIDNISKCKGFPKVKVEIEADDS